LQIAQQSSEGFLVVVMLLPTGEVSDVACPLEVCRPAGRALHHSGIKANRKQDHGIPGLLLGKRSLDLKFHPRTGNGMLGEHQQQPVIEADGLVDALPDLVAGLHVFGGEPAAHALLLQVGIETPGKVLVFARIAQKAGIVLDGMLGQGAGRGDESIAQARSSQEHLWNIPLRTRNGVRANGRGTFMMNCFQSFGGSQIHIREDRPSYRGVVEVGSAKVGSAEAGSAEAGSAEVGTVEVGTVEVGMAEVGTEEVGIAEVGIAEVGIAEAGTEEIGMAEVGTEETGMAEVGTTEVGTDEVGILEVGTVEVGTVEVGTVEVGTVEVGTVEVGMAEVGTVEVGTAEVGTTEVGSAEGGTEEVGSAEIGIAEIRPYLWTLSPPCIPGLPSSLEHIEVFLAGHRVFLPLIDPSHYSYASLAGRGTSNTRPSEYLMGDEEPSRRGFAQCRGSWGLPFPAGEPRVSEKYLMNLADNTVA